MPIDFESRGGGTSMPFPKAGLYDEGEGFHAVVVHSEVQEKQRPVRGRDGKITYVTDTFDNGNPKDEFVYHLAVIKGRAEFVKRDANGDVERDANDEPAFEVRDLENEDVVLVTSSWWLMEKCIEKKLDEGHEFTLKRLSARGAKNVKCELEIVGTVDNPKHFNPVKSTGGIDFDSRTSEPEPVTSPF